jgi:hypothetical protein
MASVRIIVFVIVAMINLTACSWISNQVMSSHTVDLRNRVYSTEPLWESSQVVSCSGRSETVATVTMFSDSISRLTIDRPGLAMIAAQVFADDIRELALPDKDAPHVIALRDLQKRHEKKGGPELLSWDETPLPDEVKKLRVTKVITAAAIQQSHASRCHPMSAAAFPKSVPDTLSAKDFIDFGEAASRSFVSPYQSSASPASKARAKKFDICNKNDKKLTWECLFGGYMMAYYNGNFIDRNGGTYSKPKIGLTITNETITAAAAILLEALFDFSLIDAPDVKTPIVYTTTFLTAPLGASATSWPTGKGNFNPAGQYAYVVTAKNAHGETVNSAEVQVDVAATDVVALSWNPVAGATSYNIYRTRTPGTYSSPALLASTSFTSYRDGGTATGAGDTPAKNTAQDGITWITKDGRTPTLATLAIELGVFDPKSPQNVGYLFVGADNRTMDAKRLCVARLLGGWAGDTAQPLTGVIMRALGGANLGVTFGLGGLGKFSFGDNETLTKLVDTIVENFPRRLTEMTVEHVLYGDAAEAAPPVKASLAVADLLTDCKGK